MYIEQLYTPCLSEAAYFICDGNEAAVIDPLRDVDAYIKLAEKHGVKIKYIFETHFHADFVSGHLDLAAKTGATIVYGPDTEAGFDFYTAKDEEVFTIGQIQIRALHTPGHTLESTCYLLSDSQGLAQCIFTGDTLFVGDVGRPDLFSGNQSKETLAAKMFRSLQEKILPLDDHIIVYPAHGPGSACGKNLGPERQSTIGIQKATNYALQSTDEAGFVKMLCEGLKEAPAYFPKNAEINQKGYKSLDTVLEKGLKALSVDEMKAKITAGATVLDTREALVFTAGFVPESVSIGLEGRFAEWAASLLDFNQVIVLVCDPGKEQESIVRLSRVGLDNVEGYLSGGFDSWRQSGEPIDMIIDIEADELALDIPHDDLLEIIDVRSEQEFNSGHVEGATHIPLSNFRDIIQLASINTDGNLYIHCAGGYRSVIAASILKQQGFHNLRNVLGGYQKIQYTKGIPLKSGSTDKN